MVLDEIAARLVAQNVGTVNVSIFLGSAAVMPTGDGPYLTLTETGGTGAAMTQNDTATERPSVQLHCRAASYVAARTMIKAAYAALGGANGLHNVVLSGTPYLSVKARQGVTDLMQLDGAGRAMLVFNVDCEKSPS